MLQSGPVGRLIDVRRFPGSRRNPHLSRDALGPALESRGVAYEWWGETLGGRRRLGPPPSRHPAWRDTGFRAYAEYTDTAEFRDAIVALEAAARAAADRGAPELAVMCSETVWWRCHRRMIADVLVARGHRVVHLLDATHHQTHRLDAGARIGDDGWPVYDVGVSAELPLDAEPPVTPDGG